MEKLVRLTNILAAGVFYPVFLIFTLALAIGLIFIVSTSKMNIGLKCLNILLISVYAIINFAAVWIEARKTIDRNFPAKQNCSANGS